LLGVVAERIDADKPLLKLGLDSLMAVEVRNWIETELRLNLPIVEVMRSPGLSHLIDLLLSRLPGAADPVSATGNRRAAFGRKADGQKPMAETMPFPLSHGQHSQTLFPAARFCGRIGGLSRRAPVSDW
jgi:hypothetical protein